MMKILKVADHAKIVSKVGWQIEVETVESDCKKMFDWWADWQMLSNTDFE